jgi:hypothetical protein
MAGRMIRVQHQPFDIGGAEMEYSCFPVIDPHDGMKVMTIHRAGSFHPAVESYTVASAVGMDDARGSAEP